MVHSGSCLWWPVQTLSLYIARKYIQWSTFWYVYQKSDIVCISSSSHWLQPADTVVAQQKINSHLSGNNIFLSYQPLLCHMSKYGTGYEYFGVYACMKDTCTC